jgi:predicted aldo/keto reductase-like oxidoreductase
MPCPEGIHIPYYLFALDRYNLNDIEGAKSWLAFLADKDMLGDASPADCTECGECLEKCTQKLQIIEKLKDAAELFS